jgi:hypothetical protein
MISTEHTTVKLVRRAAKTAVPRARPRLLTAMGFLETSVTLCAAGAASLPKGNLAATLPTDYAVRSRSPEKWSCRSLLPLRR